jgi:hypothetical protein
MITRTLASSDITTALGFTPVSTGGIDGTPIGAGTPSTGNFTTLAASGAVSGAGVTALFAAPPALGGTTPAAATVTTLTINTSITGTGLTAAHASPGPIGSTSASTGAFTTVSATGLISPTSTVGIKGTITNDNAQAGSVGEYISSTVLTGSAVSLTTATSANITSISLTAGDWDVSGAISFNMAASTSVQQYQVAVSTTSATLPTTPPWARQNLNVNPYAPGAISAHIAAGIVRMSLSGTTTVYLVAQSSFTVSTMSAYGFIAARRMR